MPLVAHQSPPFSTLACDADEVQPESVRGNVSQDHRRRGRNRDRGSGPRGGAIGSGELAHRHRRVSIQADGSGLSRYNYATPETLVAILSHVDRDERLRGPFEAALPVAGRDRALETRMKGTPAEGNARIKTGSMANVRAMSGYVQTADGETLAFAIIANNFEAPASADHHSGRRHHRPPRDIQALE